MRTFLVSLILLVAASDTLGQNITWGAPVSVAPSSYDNNRPRLSLDATGKPMVVWGNVAMNGQALFARWNGSSFNSPVVLHPSTMSIFTYTWAGPEIAAKGDTVYAAFKNQPEDTGKIYLARSYDGGQNWLPLTAVDANLGSNNSRFPTIAVSADGNPMVAYMQFKPIFTDPRYVVAKSTDHGASFGAAVTAGKLSSEACDCCPGTLTVSNNTAMMFYRDNEVNIRTIWTQVSTDGGNSFPDSLQVDNTNWVVNACPSTGPDAIIVGDTAYCTFRSSPASTRAYLSKIAIGSQQLISCTQFAADFSGLQQQEYPRIANAGNAATLIWRQTVLGAAKLCISFTSDITNGFPTSYDTIASSGVMSADVAIRPGEIHVVWEDMTSGTVMYRKGTYPLGIPETNADRKLITIHPNPASSYFSVKDVKGVTNCTLTDNTGKKTVLMPEATTGVFSLAGIAAGTYVVNISDAAGNTYSGKLVVR